MPTPRRKGISAKQSRRTSRRMDGATIGTHVQGGSQSRRRTQNAGSVSFSNARATSRASRGMVDTITPTTASGEDAAAYRRRAGQRRYIEEVQRKARRRRILTFVVAALVVVGVAVGAGMLAFRGTVGSGMSLGDSDAKSALVAPEDGEAAYTLIAVDLGAVAKPLERSGPDVLLLARIDEQAKSLALINIPADLRISSGSGDVQHLCEAAVEGDAALVSAVSKFAGVPISHIVKVSQDDLVAIVDDLGGVDVEVSQVIDDPQAGDVYIPAGSYTVTGDSVLTFLRATNLKLGVADQLSNQLDFAAALLAKFFGDDGQIEFSSRLGGIEGRIQTDYSYDQIATLQTWLKDVPASGITCVSVPGYTTAVTGVVEGEASYYIASSQDIASIIATLDEGGDVHAEKTQIANVDKSSFTVAVQNGASIVGAAAATSEALTAAGFKVGEVGNAEQIVYNETLVVYKDGYETQAEAVIDAIGIGRAVYASYYYEFEGEVLVIIGADYMPTS